MVASRMTHTLVNGRGRPVIVTNSTLRHLPPRDSVAAPPMADPSYGLPHVIIPNPEAFAAKKARLMAAGLGQLQVISDFDKTLTPVKHQGRPAASTYGKRLILFSLTSQVCWSRQTC